MFTKGNSLDGEEHISRDMAPTYSCKSTCSVYEFHNTPNVFELSVSFMCLIFVSVLINSYYYYYYCF